MYKQFILLIVLHSTIIINGVNCDSSKLPEYCGQQNVSTTASDLRILGGKEALAGEWPWLVFFTFRAGNRGEDEYACGASIINERWILTAAHCIGAKDINTYAVYVGAIDLQKLNASLKLTVEKTIRHEQFVEDEMQNDIALIKTRENIDFSSKRYFAQPICLPSMTNEPQTNCYTTGWGESDYPLNTILMKVKEPIYNTSACKLKYPAIVQEMHVCAGGGSDGGMGTCNGDSGGPLQCVSQADKRWYQIGIVSFGKPCAHPDIPDVFTRVANYRNWIEKKLLSN